MAAGLIEVRVCGGSTCRQRGSYAAYLELEELATELASHSCNGSCHEISVERVGCSHQCDRAPVAQVRITPRGSAKPQPTITVSVDDPAQCKLALDSALVELGGVPGGAAELNRTGVSRLMRRRADALRWEALRSLARAHDPKTFRDGWVLFEKAADADEAAANGDAQSLQRARARARRMRDQVALLKTSCHDLRGDA